MTQRRIGTKTLAPQCHVVPSAIGLYRAGRNLPTMETADRLAQALDWPPLRELAKAGRRSLCVLCGREVVTEGGRPRLYCGPECQWLAVKKAQGNKSPGKVLAEAVEAELARVRESQFPVQVSRRTLTAAVDVFHRDANKNKRFLDLAERKSADRQAAIDAMCRDCEPEGLCQTAECPLRAFSPLPLSKRHLSVDTATPAEGVHGPTYRPKWLAAVRKANARRWTPEERERASVGMRAYHDAHPEHADLTRAGVKRRDERRRQSA